MSITFIPRTKFHKIYAKSADNNELIGAFLFCVSLYRFDSLMANRFVAVRLLLSRYNYCLSTIDTATNLVRVYL